MGIGDFVEKAKDLAADNADKVKDGIEQAGDIADEKTGAEYSDKIDQGEEAAKGYVDGLDNE